MMILERAVRTSNSYMNYDRLKWERVRMSREKFSALVKAGAGINEWNQNGSEEMNSAESFMDKLNRGYPVTTKSFHYRLPEGEKVVVSIEAMPGATDDQKALAILAQEIVDMLSSKNMVHLAWDKNGRVFAYAKKPFLKGVSTDQWYCSGEHHEVTNYGYRDVTNYRVLPYEDPKDWKTAYFDASDYVARARGEAPKAIEPKPVASLTQDQKRLIEIANENYQRIRDAMPAGMEAMPYLAWDLNGRIYVYKNRPHVLADLALWCDDNWHALLSKHDYGKPSDYKTAVISPDQYGHYKKILTAPVKPTTALTRDQKQLARLAEEVIDFMLNNDYTTLAWDSDGEIYAYSGAPAVEHRSSDCVWTTKDSAGNHLTYDFIDLADLEEDILEYEVPEDAKTAILNINHESLKAVVTRALDRR